MPKKLCNSGSIAVYKSGFANGGAAYSQFAAIYTHHFWFFRGHTVFPADPPQNNMRLLHFRGVPASSHSHCKRRNTDDFEGIDLFFKKLT